MYVKSDTITNFVLEWNSINFFNYYIWSQLFQISFKTPVWINARDGTYKSYILRQHIWSK